MAGKFDQKLFEGGFLILRELIARAPYPGLDLRSHPAHDGKFSSRSTAKRFHQLAHRLLSRATVGKESDNEKVQRAQRAPKEAFEIGST